VNNDYVLNLSTQVKPAKKFLVDGEPYDMLGLEHLSPEMEARSTALFSRHEAMQRQLSTGLSQHESESVAKRMRDVRVEIIATLTTMPKDKISELPLPAQVDLLDALRIEQMDDGAVSGAAA